MAHLYAAEVEWRLAEDADAWRKGRYSRAHLIRFDGDVEVAGSPSPSVVPKPMSREEAVDPEEMLVASLSSCHMLVFLDLARRAGIAVTAYADKAEGRMSKLEDGRWWVSHVVLRPAIDSDATAEQLADLHHRAHEGCFIANSVRTEVTVEAPRAAAPAALARP